MGNRTGVPRQQTPVRDRRRAHPSATVGGAGGAIHPGRYQPGDHLVRPPRPARSRPRRLPRPRPLVHHQAGRLGRRHAHRAPPRTPDRQVSPTSPRPGHLRPIPRRPAQPPGLRRITPKHEYLRSVGLTAGQDTNRFLAIAAVLSFTGYATILFLRSPLYFPAGDFEDLLRAVEEVG